MLLQTHFFQLLVPRKLLFRALVATSHERASGAVRTRSLLLRAVAALLCRIPLCFRPTLDGRAALGSASVSRQLRAVVEYGEGALIGALLVIPRLLGWHGDRARGVRLRTNLLTALLLQWGLVCLLHHFLSIKISLCVPIFPFSAVLQS